MCGSLPATVAPVWMATFLMPSLRAMSMTVATACSAQPFVMSAICCLTRSSAPAS